MFEERCTTRPGVGLPGGCVAIVLAILAFGFLIAFHELGHMWVARRMGMRVERYSIGFGPALFTWRRGETDYVISALPLGGYVKIAGMGDEDDEASADDPGSYLSKPAWRRFLVIAAGPAANYLLAFLIGVPLLLAAGKAADPSSRIGEVLAGSAAEQAGIVVGDEIRSIGGTAVEKFAKIPETLLAAVKAAPGAPLALVVARDGVERTVTVTPKDDGSGRFRLGIGPALVDRPGLPFPRAVIQAAENIFHQNVAIIDMLAKMVTRRAPAELSGPIGIIAETAKSAERGIFSFLITVWSISISVALLNLLPVPGLDGGRMVFLGYEVIARRRANRRVEGWIHTAGILALLLLILVVSYGDVMKRIITG